VGHWVDILEIDKISLQPFRHCYLCIHP
jgi:hypothetical protein